MKRTVLVAASVLLVAGCGNVGDGGVVDAEPGADTTATTDLTVVVKAGAGKAERTYTLVCDPAGGDHPDPEAACRSLDELAKPFAPVPRDAMCTEIYGGPQTATVTGTFRGEHVNAHFSRTDGCEISRWDRHRALLVAPGGVDGT
jgi:hypothetical protein